MKKIIDCFAGISFGIKVGINTLIPYKIQQRPTIWVFWMTRTRIILKIACVKFIGKIIYFVALSACPGKLDYTHLIGHDQFEVSMDA